MAVHFSVQSFSMALRRYTEKTVPDLARDRMTVIALEAARQVTLLTPVDTGRAKGGWQFTVGNAAGYAEGEPGRMDPSKEGVPGMATQMDVFDQMPNWNPGDWLWLHNGVPYITYLNDGTDKTSAHHMLERTVAHLKRWLKI